MTKKPVSYEEEQSAYNASLEEVTQRGYYALNHFVMDHTYRLCKELPELSLAIENAIAAEEVFYEFGFPIKDFKPCPNELVRFIPGGESDGPTTNIILSPKRTFEAARAYKGKKVAVLSFANNHSVGGAPWSAGAQEECLCRASTLFPCLEAKYKDFYQYHQDFYRKGAIHDYGNADMIYTPNVIVFKSDQSAPKLLNKEDWHSVDVITSAAPIMGNHYGLIEYHDIMGLRINRILSLAKAKGVEVLILGAFGCGAFHNDPHEVAAMFKMALEKFHFETVEFAIYDHNPGPSSNFEAFKKIFRR